MDDIKATEQPEESKDLLIPEDWAQTEKAKALRAELTREYPDLDPAQIDEVIWEKLFTESR